MKDRKETERRMGLREAAQITGVPIPTLSYWVTTGIIRPKEARGEGRGGCAGRWRCWSDGSTCRAPWPC